jgi:sugar transferase EpsL
MAYRLRDIVLALIGLLACSWLFLLLIPILAISQERIFFIQQRTGLHKQPFFLIKFSTLRDIVEGEKEEDNQQARLTVVGKILRRLSFDEIPQLINVLKGDMSLVGPRPFIHEYLPLYTEQQSKRFDVRPGITGWAQINGRNQISFTERIELDLWYISNRSLGLDFKIMFKTFLKAFGGKGVYINAETTAEKFDGTN